MQNVEMVLGALQQFKEYTTARLDKMEDIMSATLSQATKTNGRVDVLEREGAKVKEAQNKKSDWRQKVILILLGSFGTLVCGVILNVIIKRIH